MNRRSFLKAAVGGLGGLAVAAPFGSAAVAQMFDPFGGLGIKLPPVFLHPTLASGSKAPVGARIACLYDISGSIDEVEHSVQLNVMADTIESEDIRNAIFYEGGPQSLALCVADFGTTADMRIGWVDIRKGQDYKLKAIADEIRALPRRETGMTNTVSGFDMAEQAMANCPWRAERSMVDILTDGIHNGGGTEQDVVMLRDKLATIHESTVNALITLDPSEPRMEEWARNVLVTPARFLKRNGALLDPGFVKAVATQQTDAGALVKYQDAMKIAFRRKLILEVAGVDEDTFRRRLNGRHADAPKLMM